MPEQSKPNGTKLQMIDKRVCAIIAVIELMLAYSLLYVLISMDIADTKKDICIYVLGAVTAHISQTLSYFFGSSKSSADKDERAFQQNMADKGKSNE